MRITQSVRKLTPYVPGEQPKDENVSVKAPTNHFIHLSGDGATYNENSQE